MNDSLISVAIDESRAGLASLQSSDGQALRARLGVLAGAAFAMRLEDASREEVVRLACAAIAVRDEVQALCARLGR